MGPSELTFKVWSLLSGFTQMKCLAPHWWLQYKDACASSHFLFPADIKSGCRKFPPKAAYDGIQWPSTELCEDALALASIPSIASSTKKKKKKSLPRPSHLGEMVYV